MQRAMRLQAELRMLANMAGISYETHENEIA